MARGIRSAVLRVGSIVVLLALWWIAARLMHDPEVLPGPWVIGRTIVFDLTHPGLEDKSAFFHIGITLARIFIAFTASMLPGLGIGLAMGLRPLRPPALLRPP